MKFKNDIEAQAGFKDAEGDLGIAGQLLSSTGTETNWIDQSTIASGSAEVVDIKVKNISAANGGINLSKGDPVYIYGSVGASARLYVDLADADSTATNNLGDGKMPCVGLLDQDLSPNGEGTATVVGKLRNLITNPIDGDVPNENDTVYVKSGGGLTLTKPTGSTNLIQNVGQVGRVSTSADGNIVVAALLRSNDVPNLPEGRIWIGDGNTIVSDTVYVDEPNNRVGIGTTNPSTKLHIEDTNPTLKILSNQVFGPSQISMGNGTSEAGLITCLDNPAINFLEIKYDNGGSGDGRIRVGQNNLDFLINSVTAMYINSSKNVGIGTTSLTNISSAGATLSLGSTSATISGGIAFQANGVVKAYNYVSAGYLYNQTVAGIGQIFFGAGSERMRIHSTTGNVGIGTTNPNHELDVAGDIYSSGQMLTEGQYMASFTVLGDLDTGLGNWDGSGQVGLVSNNKAVITAKDDKIAFDAYDATAVATTGSLNPNQSQQAVTEDTLAILAVDPDGNVVRGSQEGTWTFTKAQIDALTTSTTSGTTLIAAPGANKAVIVEESNLMIKYSGTGTMSSNSFVIRQAHNGDAAAEITRLPSGQINTIMSSAPANPSYGFYSRDLPLYNNDGRSFVTNKATFLSRISTNATPTNLVSISIKLKYRLFDVDTF